MPQITGAEQKILPVVIGGDVAAYALARAFHESFGVKTVIVSPAPIKAIERSKICIPHRTTGYLNPEELLQSLEQIAREYPDTRRILMCNGDYFAGVIIRNRTRLEKYYALPFPSVEAFEKVTNKVEFAKLCDRLAVPTPHTRVATFRDGVPTGGKIRELAAGAAQVVVKPADGEAYARSHFADKRKIYFFSTNEEMDTLEKNLAEANYTGEFLVQEQIPGDDTCMRSVTLYRDSRGVTTMYSSARVLLEDHSPTMIGNPVAMITEPFPDLYKQADRLLQEVDFKGFANLDIKVNPRDGIGYFFEINPRIGRNCYYTVASNTPALQIMAKDLLLGEELSACTTKKSILYSLIPHRLLYRYLKDPVLRHRAKKLVNEKQCVNPVENPFERDIIRKIVVWLQKLNYYRKFRSEYPPQAHAHR